MQNIVKTNKTASKNITSHLGCFLFRNLTNIDRSSPVKKNAQIFLVVVSVVNLFSSVPNLHRAPQNTPSFISIQTTRMPGSTDGHG